MQAETMMGCSNLWPWPAGVQVPVSPWSPSVLSPAQQRRRACSRPASLHQSAAQLRPGCLPPLGPVSSRSSPCPACLLGPLPALTKQAQASCWPTWTRDPARQPHPTWPPPGWPAATSTWNFSPRPCRGASPGGAASASTIGPGDRSPTGASLTTPAQPALRPRCTGGAAPPAPRESEPWAGRPGEEGDRQMSPGVPDTRSSPGLGRWPLPPALLCCEACQWSRALPASSPVLLVWPLAGPSPSSDKSHCHQGSPGTREGPRLQS